MHRNLKDLKDDDDVFEMTSEEKIKYTV